MPTYHRLHDLLQLGRRNVPEHEIPDPGPDSSGGGMIKTLAAILDHRTASACDFQSCSIGNRCTAPLRQRHSWHGRITDHQDSIARPRGKGKKITRLGLHHLVFIDEVKQCSIRSGMVLSLQTQRAQSQIGIEELAHHTVVTITGIHHINLQTTTFSKGGASSLF